MRIAIVDDVAAERALLRSRLESQVRSRHLSVQILEFDSGETFLTAALMCCFCIFTWAGSPVLKRQPNFVHSILRDFWSLLPHQRIMRWTGSVFGPCIIL